MRRAMREYAGGEGKAESVSVKSCRVLGGGTWLAVDALEWMAEDGAGGEGLGGQVGGEGVTGSEFLRRLAKAGLSSVRTWVQGMTELIIKVND